MILTEQKLRMAYLTRYKGADGSPTFAEFVREQRRVDYGFKGLSFATLDGNALTEGEESSDERERVLSLIRGDEFDVNKRDEFIAALQKSKRGGFLSAYSAEDYLKSFTTYKVKGYDIGFAVKKDGDIVSVFNNSAVRGVSDELIAAAKRHGGRKLDHFDGKLSDLYGKHGFKEVHREKWSDEYRPAGWRDEDGTPDVVYREL